MTAGRRAPTPLAPGTSSRPIPTALPSRLVLFDGTCGLCDRTVRWMIDHDTDRVLRYAPLQGETAGRLRQCWPEDFPNELDTVIFVDTTGSEAQILKRSRAILAILDCIRPPSLRLRILRLVPRLLMDLAYRCVGRLRYRFFGKFDECRIPSTEERDLFLA